MRAPLISISLFYHSNIFFKNTNHGAPHDNIYAVSCHIISLKYKFPQHPFPKQPRCCSLDVRDRLSNIQNNR